MIPPLVRQQTAGLNRMHRPGSAWKTECKSCRCNQTRFRLSGAEIRASYQYSGSIPYPRQRPAYINNFTQKGIGEILRFIKVNKSFIEYPDHAGDGKQDKRKNHVRVPVPAADAKKLFKQAEFPGERQSHYAQKQKHRADINQAFKNNGSQEITGAEPVFFCNIYRSRYLTKSWNQYIHEVTEHHTCKKSGSRDVFFYIAVQQKPPPFSAQKVAC